MVDEEPDEAATGRFVEFLRAAVRAALKTPEPDAFLAWVEDRGARLMPAPEGTAFEAKRVVARLAGRALWNALPQPSNGYRPRPLPVPGRNEPCSCGSGEKFKRCCDGRPPVPISADELWAILVDVLPLKELESLGQHRAVPPEAISWAAERLLNEGREKKVLRLLEGLFEDPGRLDGRYEEALDTLLDLYTTLGDSEAKQSALSRFAREMRPPLRAAVWSRLAVMAIDGRSIPEARGFLARAQTDNPDDPNLSILEAVLLIEEGQPEQAARRARFWVARLKALDAKPLRDAVEAIAADPRRGGVAYAAGHYGEPVLRFFDVVEAAGRRAPAADYALEPMGGPRGPLGERMLVPGVSVSRVDEAWKRVCPVEAPFSIQLPQPPPASVWGEGSGEWLSFLEGHPEAVDSLQVLDGLATIVLAIPGFGLRSVDDALLRPLLARGAAILDAVQSGCPGALVPWISPDNRPALRLLAHGVHLLERAEDGPGAEAAMEKLIALNPNDNHGHRGPLMTAYLGRGDDERALTLAAPYDDDLTPEIQYGRALALFRLGRREEADARIAAAVKDSPLVAAYLVAPNPAEPEVDPFAVTLGGPDEAWLYREDALDLWQATPGAVAWLGAALVASRSRGKGKAAAPRGKRRKG